MPLLDHFRSPVSERRPWQSIHTHWIAAISEQLNLHVLPPGYVALMTANYASRFEVDIPTFHVNGTSDADATVSDSPWGPPQATFTLPALMPDTVEAKIFDQEFGQRLVGAIELVSPSNKDRPTTRQAFVAKSSHLLLSGVGLVVVDVVTTRSANLHNELTALLEPQAPFLFPPAIRTYAACYHPVQQLDTPTPWAGVELWPFTLAVGEKLPTVPLALMGGPTVPVDLELTYMESLRRLRM